MATAQTVVEICSGALSCLSNSKSYLSLSLPGSLSTYFVRHKRRSVATRFQIINHSNKICNCVACQFPRVSITSNPLGPVKCNCQRAESASGVTSEDSNGTWFVDNANVYSAINGDKLNVLEVEAITESSSERVDFSSSGGILNNETVQDLQEGIAESFEDEAWELLKKSIVNYEGSPVGTIAAKDPDASNVLNYDHVFIRDFIPSGIAFLLKGEYDIVRNFLLQTLYLQGWDKTMDCHSPGEGLMPASFKARKVSLDEENSEEGEILDPDFGEAAIGRVAPVDSGLWWIILLRAYGKCSGELSLQEGLDAQSGIKMILRLCLADGFDLFPMLLVTDGSCMIDRRMGIHGHPLEIQALFYSALRCAREMLVPKDEDADHIEELNNRLAALSIHIRENYWIDMRKLNEIYRYKTEWRREKYEHIRISVDSANTQNNRVFYIR